MSPYLVASLSVIPGLGHWVVGKRGKAIAFIFIDLSIIVSLFFFKSLAGYLLIFLGYLMAMIPAVFETYALARGGESGFSESKPYIVGMLLVEGFAALPLLWQSPSFSRRDKIAWSIAVPVLAVIYLSSLGVFGLRFLNHFKI